MLTEQRYDIILKLVEEKNSMVNQCGRAGQTSELYVQAKTSGGATVQQQRLPEDTGEKAL